MLYFKAWEIKKLVAYPLLRRGNPPNYERRAMPMYVTYTDLIQIGIFIVALVGLCYQIFKDKK